MLFLTLDSEATMFGGDSLTQRSKGVNSWARPAGVQRVLRVLSLHLFLTIITDYPCFPFHSMVLKKSRIEF